MMQTLIPSRGSKPLWPGSQFHKICLQAVASSVPSSVPDAQNWGEVAPPAGARNKYIVIIDDSPTVCKIAETALRREGYEADGYHDGIEAFRAFALLGARIPDLIVLDIGLPKIGGYEVARRLRRHTAFQHISLVILTRRDGIVDRLKGRLAGARVYLTKPFRTQDLVAIIRKQLGEAPDEESQP